MSYGAPYGYGSGYGYGVTGFVGILDRLSVQPYSFWSAARRASSRWGGPVGRLYRTTDGVELDVYGSGRWGLVDPWEIAYFGGWNLIPFSDSLIGGSWGSLGNGTGSAPTVTGGFPDPDGGTIATRLQMSLNGGTTADDYSVYRYSGSPLPTSGLSYEFSAWIRSYDGSTYTLQIRQGNTTQAITVDATWQLVSVIGSSGTTRWLGLRGDQAGVSNTADVLVCRAMIRRTTAPSAYERRTTTAAGDVLWTKLYDQTGAGRHFEQASNLIMLYACKSGVPVTENGIQSAEFVASDARRMAVPSSTASYNFLHTTGGTVSSVFRTNDTAASKMIAGNRTTSNATRGFALFADAAEGVITRVGRIDVAGVATTGYSINRDTSLGRVLTNRSGLWHLDPDAALAADRLAYWQNNANSLSAANTESGNPFVESATGNLTLGAASDASIPCDGTITELGIWNSLIGSVDRGLLWSDASSLWGL